VTMDRSTSPDASITRPDGQVRTFDDFYLSEVHLLVGFLMMLGYGRSFAEDIAQETMLQLYRAWGRVAEPRAWTRLVARRMALKATQRRPREVPVDSISLLEDRVTVEQPEVLAGTDLLNTLSSLPNRQRQVLAFYIDGFTVEEIATVLGTTASSVRSNLRHARNSVKAKLSTDYSTPE
jgi:RNA polymerase sigma factor (sigma-70 family)